MSRSEKMASEITRIVALASKVDDIETAKKEVQEMLWREFLHIHEDAVDATFRACNKQKFSKPIYND